jgi:hypothetical protein
MCDYLSILPTELIEKILDHISTGDILSSICLVNKRLYSVSHIYSRFLIDFNCIAKKKKQFDLLCNNLPNLTSRIASLTFDNDDNTIINAKNIRFLCSISANDIFPNLHSITFNKMISNVWNEIRIRLPSFIALRSMSIADVDDSEQLMSFIFHDLLFTVRSLKYLFLVNTSSCQNEIMTISSSSFMMQKSNIECLTLKGIQINLYELVVVAPMLRQLDANLLIHQSIYDNTMFQPSFNFHQLSITINHITILEIKNLLSSMTHLTHFTLHVNETESDLINGHRWIPLLTRIIVFRFMFGISDKDNVDLDTFRTQFWVEEKKWYVTYDQWIDTSVSFLYTNPCCTEYRYPLPRMKKTLITESTGLEPMTFPYTQYLIFGYDLPMPKEHLRRFTHIHTLIVENNLDLSFEYIISCIDLSNITIFLEGNPEKEQLNLEFVRILHSLPHLRSICLNISTVNLLFDRHWPKIINLNMKTNMFNASKYLSSIEIDAFWRSFTHLERLAFDRESIQDLLGLFNNMTKTLSNIRIRHFGIICNYDPEPITRQWLEQNTKLTNFEYFYENWSDVYLWL